MRSLPILLLIEILFTAFSACNASPISDSAVSSKQHVEMEMPGKCTNISVAGTCTFTNVHPIDPKSGAPLPLDLKVGPGETVLFEIGYSAPNGSDIPFSIRVRAEPKDRMALERYYSSHSEVPCVGVIFKPPCAPSVDVTVQVPPPPVGTVETSR